jgi:hypothetical protein
LTGEHKHSIEIIDGQRVNRHRIAHKISDGLIQDHLISTYTISSS